MRFAEALCILCAALVLSACGGGGGGSGSPAVATPASPTTPSATGSNGAALPAAANLLPLVIDSGPPGVSNRIANVPYASVTVCPPGSTANCRTIDHLIVDTGSVGLRVLASALGSTASYPQQTTTTGAALAECSSFVSGFTWGGVRRADVTLGALTAASLSIQVIADPVFPTVPTACANTGVSQNTVADLGANGVLGIGHFPQDCGAACVSAVQSAYYYVCPTSGGCTPVSVPLDRQVAHPIARLPSDNNGSSIQFPAVSQAGQATAAGALVLGIGTRANNATGTAVAYGVNRNTGLLSTTYNGRTYSRSAFDSGSNFYFFTDASLPTCSGASSFYCPAATLSLSAVVTGSNGASVSVPFRVANASSLFATASSTVLPDVGASLGSPITFLWGLPFFYGRTVFTAIVDAATPLGTGPFVAF